MNNLIKQKIIKSGLKKVFIADQLGISKSMFSQVLRGTKTLSAENEIKLKELLDRVVA
jgi:predicted transcriptional regulator